MLILAAAVAHATWNLAAKRAGDGGAAFVGLSAALAAVIYLPVVSVALLLQRPSFGSREVVAVLVSAVLHLGYYLLLQRGYRHGDLSVVYPLARGTGPLLATAGAIVLLGERPSALGLAGGLVVVIGVVVLAVTAVPSTEALDSPRSLWRAGLGYGVATGVLIAAYTLWDARAVAELGMSPVVFEWGVNTTRAVLLSPAVVSRPAQARRVWRQYRREVLLVALLSPLSYVLVLVALTTTPVALVAPAREVSILIGVMFGSGLLAEGKGLQRAAGAVAVVAGILLLASG